MEEISVRNQALNNTINRTVIFPKKKNGKLQMKNYQMLEIAFMHAQPLY